MIFANQIDNFFFIYGHLTLSDNSLIQFCFFLLSLYCSHLSKTFNINWIFDNDRSCFPIETDDVTILVKKFAKSFYSLQTCAELYFSATLLATCAVWLMKHLFETRFIDANNFDFSLENVTRDVTCYAGILYFIHAKLCILVHGNLIILFVYWND